MRAILWALMLIVTVFPSIALRGNRESVGKSDSIHLRGELVSIDSVGTIDNGELVVNDTVDLDGYTCVLPDDILLIISGGQIRNGELVGRNTRLKCSDNSFSRVKISGDWNVPTIRSSFLSDISYENALCDIVAFSNKKIKNKILIEKGDYHVAANTPWHSCVSLNSNTEFILRGTIKLVSNSFLGYNIINVTGENINIEGTGRIMGDKENHTGSTGEWGMGINVQNAENIKISGITVESCWGDCIYVGKANNVFIDKCILTNSRRQGISITAGTNIKIRNCAISKIKGTAPEYAIDIEPNKDNHCTNILIQNVSMVDCQGGVLVYGGAKNASVNSVVIRSCNLERIGKSPFRFDDANRVTVEKCRVRASGRKDPFTLINLRDFRKRGVIIE